MAYGVVPAINLSQLLFFILKILIVHLVCAKSNTLGMWGRANTETSAM